MAIISPTINPSGYINEISGYDLWLLILAWRLHIKHVAAKAEKSVRAVYAAINFSMRRDTLLMIYGCLCAASVARLRHRFWLPHIQIAQLFLLERMTLWSCLLLPKYVPNSIHWGMISFTAAPLSVIDRTKPPQIFLVPTAWRSVHVRCEAWSISRKCVASVPGPTIVLRTDTVSATSCRCFLPALHNVYPVELSLDYVLPRMRRRCPPAYSRV